MRTVKLERKPLAAINHREDPVCMGKRVCDISRQAGGIYNHGTLKTVRLSGTAVDIILPTGGFILNKIHRRNIGDHIGHIFIICTDVDIDIQLS